MVGAMAAAVEVAVAAVSASVVGSDPGSGLVVLDCSAPSVWGC